MTDVIERYCDMIPGGESMLPLIVMKDHLDTTCTFLKKGQCTVHEAKPIACALHPLGRIDIFNEETGRNEFHYYLKEFICDASRDESVKVQDWLDMFGIEEYDECVRLYKRMGAVCSKIMHALKTDAERREMFGMAFFMMYAKYDMNEELLPQIAQNLAFIQSINPDIAFDKSKMM
jgi:Fe-S-cluster containining protein